MKINFKIRCIIGLVGFLLMGNAETAFSQTTVNVKDYGAKGNGTSNDTEAILKAFKAIQSKGGTVHFPRGEYLTNIIDIKPSKGTSVTVTGETGKSIIRKNPNDKVNIALFFCEVPGVKLTFRDLVLDGSADEKVNKWKTFQGKTIDVDANINGIYAYNVESLNVSSCEVKNFHGKGIACYSSGEFIATNNKVSDVSGSGIMGHRVVHMEARDNSVSNTGFIANTYILDGTKHTKSNYFPRTKYGDGIEGECSTFIVENNVILNPGRCGIVHDLARDLGYKESVATVLNNTITINSTNINNDNPPSGMWFEQSHIVNVKNNKVYIRKSTSKLVTGIRFFEISNRIDCQNNIIDAIGYNHSCNSGIGVYEPSLSKLVISKNTVKGNFGSAVVVSYADVKSKIDQVTITGNKFESAGGKLLTGIEMSISANRKFPAATVIQSNIMNSVINEPYKFYYYGDKTGTKIKSAVIRVNNNKIQ